MQEFVIRDLGLAKGCQPLVLRLRITNHESPITPS